MIRLTADLRETVIAIAAEAGAAIMAVYANDFEVQIKADASPLTQADLAANRVIVDGLRRLTPSVPVLSEESAQVPWDERRHWTSYWLVDPLDGTREFVKRNGEFSVNIALIHLGSPVLGVVQAPVDGRIWHAARGEQALLREVHRDTALSVRAPATS
ncbi:3'(2'),5'-bisphosphate nucleotidase CysQ, partial [Xanthomonas sp. Kuri4-2]